MSMSLDKWPHDVHVCIPAFQACRTLAKLLPELLNVAPADRVLVADDGSADATSGLCSGYGVRHIRLSENRGKGAALAEGFKTLLNQNARAVITMDADGQHAVADLEAFINDFRLHPEAGIIIGRRMFGKGGMPLSRIISNTLTSGIISLLSGVHIPDSQCGFRLYSSVFLRTVTITCTRFTMESEVILKAAGLGFPIRSVRVQTLYLSGRSHIAHMTDTLRWIRAVVGIWLRLRLYGIPESRHSL